MERQNQGDTARAPCIHACSKSGRFCPKSWLNHGGCNTGVGIGALRAASAGPSLLPSRNNKELFSKKGAQRLQLPNVMCQGCYLKFESPLALAHPSSAPLLPEHPSKAAGLEGDPKCSSSLRLQPFKSN